MQLVICFEYRVMIVNKRFETNKNRIYHMKIG